MQQQLVDAQMSIERDYARLRQTELRYRLLFQIASEAIIIADATTARITEVNPAALALIGEPSKKIAAQTLLELIDPADGPALQDLLATVRSTGAGESIPVRLAGFDRKFIFSASFFRQGASAFILARLSPAEMQAPEGAQKANASLVKIMEGLPDGFVVTDPESRILTANTAFLDLAQLSNQEQARGQPLENWLGRSGVDINVLAANLREHSSVRNFSTIVRGAYGSFEEVDVSAVAVLGGELPCFGFVIRSSATRNAAKLRPANLARSVEQLTELVGRVSLKDLVREFERPHREALHRGSTGIDWRQSRLCRGDAGPQPAKLIRETAPLRAGRSRDRARRITIFDLFFAAACKPKLTDKAVKFTVRA